MRWLGSTVALLLCALALSASSLAQGASLPATASSAVQKPVSVDSLNLLKSALTEPFPTAFAVEAAWAVGKLDSHDAACVALKKLPKLLAATKTFKCEAAAKEDEAKLVAAVKSSLNRDASLAKVVEYLLSLTTEGKATQALVHQLMEEVLAEAKPGRAPGSLLLDNSPELTGRLVYACSKHAECLSSHLTADERAGFAVALVAAFDGLTSKDATAEAAGIVLGLRALSSHVVAFSLEPSILTPEQAAQPVEVQPRLTDLLSGALETSTLKIASQTPAGAFVLTKSIAQDASGGVSIGMKTVLRLDVAKAASKASKFAAEFELSPKLTQVSRSVSIQGAAGGAKDVLESAVFAVVNSSTTTSRKDSAKALFPAASATTDLSLTDGEHLGIYVKLKEAFEPEQFIAVLENPTTKDFRVRPAYAVMYKTAKEGEYMGQIAFSKLYDAFAYVSGTCTLTIVASDPTWGAENSAKWLLAKAINVKFSTSGPPKKSRPHFHEALMHESDTTLRALPEIQHVFRAADHRAHFLLSSAFSGFLVVLLVLLLGAVAKLGFAGKVVKSLPHPFSLTLLAILVLYAWFWIGPALRAPNMIELLGYYLPPLSVALFVFSSRISAGDVSKKKVSGL